MNTIDFLRAVLPPEGGYFMALKRKYLDKNTGEEREGTLHNFYDTLEELAGAIAIANDQPNKGSVWHANQSYKAAHWLDEKGKKHWRVAENRTENAHKALYLDIDCGEDKFAAGKGYRTKKDALDALKTLLVKTGLPAPLIVDSGGGLHIYWPFTEAVTTRQWRQLADGLYAACVAYEIRQDRGITCDASRVLRPVGTINRKYSPPRPVVAKNPSGFKEHTYTDLLSRLSKLPEVMLNIMATRPQTQGNLGDLLGHTPEYPPASLVVIAEHCAQVRIMRDLLGDVGYDHWRGVVGLASFCTDGRVKAVEWSSRRADTGHTQVDVEQRLDDWNAGPTTCEFFQKNGVKGGCKGCAHAGKIKSPIRLGGVAVEQPEVVTVEAVDEKAQTVELEVPTLPGFVWKAERGVMVRQFYDKDGVLQEAPFIRSLLYPINRVRDDSGKYLLQMRMVLPNKKFRDFDLPTAAISTGGTDLRKVLGSYEIYPTDNKDASMHLEAYTRNWAEEIKLRREEMQQHTTFGWTKELDGFLLGNQLIRRGKPDAQVLTSKGAAEYASSFNIRTGTVEGWCNAVAALYDRRGMEPMQYALLAGFGSILTPFVGRPDYHGIPCYLFSDGTGLGKSTVAKLALSAWGDVDRMSINGPKGATRNARFARMSTFKNLPINHDELTTAEPEFVVDLAFTMSNGTDRTRCISDGNGEVYERTSGMWDSGQYMSGNTDLLALMASEKSNTLAEAVRIFQIDVAKYDIPILDGGWVQTTVSQAIRNTGVVGEAFARWCVENPERIDELIREETESLSGPVVEENGFRFYKGHLICTLVAGRILIDEMAILPFHMDIVRGWAHMHANMTCRAVKVSNSLNPEEALSRMIGDMAPDILVTRELRDGRHTEGPEEPTYMPKGVVKGRYIFGSNRQQQYAGRVYLSISAVKQWCLDHRVGISNIMDAATAAEALIALEDNRFHLGVGTTVPSGRTRVICLDMAKVTGVSNVAPGLTLVKPVKKVETEGAA